MRVGAWACALVVVVGPFLTTSAAQVPAPTAEPVVQRFLSRPDEPLTRYRAFRRLEARNVRHNKYGWLEAWTELTPDGRFTYQIVREGGSEYVLSKVLRPLLANEQKLFATQDAGRSAFTLENYEVEGAESAGPGLVKLLIKPKRRDVSLVDGAIFVTEREADIVRLEGRLSKNPSFWTKRVDVVRRYDRIAGVRVPMSVDTVAQIRFVGQSTLTMTYEYQMVNGRLVSGAGTLAGARP